MSKRHRSSDTGDAQPEMGSDPFMTEDPIDAGADEAPVASSRQTDEQPPEEGTDAHEDPPKDGPLATMTSGTPASPPGPPPEHPELEPDVAPADLRAAPVRSDVEREAWGDKPSWTELKEATRIALRTVNASSVGLYSGGVFVRSDEQIVDVATIVARSEAHLRAIATEAQIEVRIVE